MSQSIQRLYFLRHGEVAYFDRSKKALDPWTASLTERGRGQAEALAAQRLAGGLDRIVTSAVPRVIVPVVTETWWDESRR